MGIVVLSRAGVAQSQAVACQQTTDGVVARRDGHVGRAIVGTAEVARGRERQIHGRQRDRRVGGIERGQFVVAGQSTRSGVGTALVAQRDGADEIARPHMAAVGSGSAVRQRLAAHQIAYGHIAQRGAATVELRSRQTDGGCGDVGGQCRLCQQIVAGIGISIGTGNAVCGGDRHVATHVLAAEQGTH